MKLYKFRALGNNCDLARVLNILDTGCFWGSTFFDLNDPMEGVFTLDAGKNVTDLVTKIYKVKTEKKICSFSKSYNNPLLWGYYANGFKGIAIEIETDSENPNIKQVKYTESLQHIGDISGEDILTTKLKKWKHEKEYRFIKHQQSNIANNNDIGKITAIYFGMPYQNVVNNKDIYMTSKKLKDYLKLIQTVADFVWECCNKDIKIYTVKWSKSNKVVKNKKLTKTELHKLLSWGEIPNFSKW